MLLKSLLPIWRVYSVPQGQTTHPPTMKSPATEGHRNTTDRPCVHQHSRHALDKHCMPKIIVKECNLIEAIPYHLVHNIWAYNQKNQYWRGRPKACTESCLCENASIAGLVAAGDDCTADSYMNWFIKPGAVPKPSLHISDSELGPGAVIN